MRVQQDFSEERFVNKKITFVNEKCTLVKIMNHFSFFFVNSYKNKADFKVKQLTILTNYGRVIHKRNEGYSAGKPES
jgi:hypothetical protein